MVTEIPSLVKDINTSGWQGVLAITGGGAGAIHDLLKRGGGSAMLLEAIVPYSNASFIDFVKGKPDKFVSEHAARQLAMAAYLRARKLEGTGNTPVFGIGATAALAKNGPERKEREHKVSIAYQTQNKTCVATFKLPHLGRTHEECFVADLIIRMIGDCVQKTEANWIKELGYTEDLLVAREEVFASYEMQELVHGRIDFWAPKPLPEKGPRVYFPGSFNPLHDGHREITQIAEEHFTAQCAKGVTAKVIYEISVTNCDKPPLDYIEITKRLKQFDGDIILTNAPLMLQKARVIKLATGWSPRFLCGIDSWNRVIDKKYYHNDEAELVRVMQEMVILGVKFMVFAREVDGVVQELDGSMSYFIAEKAPKIPKNMSCSSTKIRQAAGV